MHASRETRKRCTKIPDLLPMNPTDFNVGLTAEVGERLAPGLRFVLVSSFTSHLLGTVSCLYDINIEYVPGLAGLGVLQRYRNKETKSSHVWTEPRSAAVMCLVMCSRRSLLRGKKYIGAKPLSITGLSSSSTNDFLTFSSLPSRLPPRCAQCSIPPRP